MINRVLLAGEVASEIRHNKTAAGKDVHSFRVKTWVTRKHPDHSHEHQSSGNPQYQQYQQYHNITSFSGIPESLSQTDSILVEGSLSTRSYNCPRTGEKKYTTSVNAQGVYRWDDKEEKNCVIGGCKKNEEAKSPKINKIVEPPKQESTAADPADAYDDIPF